MSKTIEQLESVFPLTVGDVTFLGVEEPSILFFKLKGDDTEHYIDWLDYSVQEWSSLEDLSEDDYYKVLEVVEGAIKASNLEQEVLKPWYEAFHF